MIRALLALFLSCLTGLLLTGCSPDYEKMANQRLNYARKNQGDIHVAAIQDTRQSAFLNGVLLAAGEINQRPDKLLGHNLQIDIEQDGDDFDASKSMIHRVAANPKITAVLGHRSSSLAIPASVIYERSQVIFMPPFSTAEGLTGHNFQYVFRMVPSNAVMAEQLVSVASTLGYRKIAMLYARDDFNRELAFLVEDAAVKQHIEITNRSSFFEKEPNYRPIIAELGNIDLDAVFITAPPAAAGRMARQLREMGINKPILGSDMLNAQAYLDEAGTSAENTIIPDIYTQSRPNPRILDFIQKYRAKYDAEPDFNAAQGYDSLMLLAAGIERAKSTLPTLLSSTLHYMPAWVGITGVQGFTPTGELLGKKYFFKVWQQGSWRALPALEVPYLLERFDAYLQNKSGGQKSTHFSEAFSNNMYDEERDTFLLDLAHEILHFQRLGIIYENTEEGRKASGYPILKALADQKGILLSECEIPFSLMKQKEVEQAIVACYGKLSLNSDAMFIPPYHGVDAKLLQRLNRSLTFFKIPAISLDTHNTDPNITLLLGKRSDVPQQETGGMQVYSSLLKNLKVYDFADRLQGLPEITVNLNNLQSYGLSDYPILLLSPDNYLQSDSLAMPEENPS